MMTTLFAALISTSSHAEPCQLSKNYCVPFVGCFESGDGFFHGMSFGKREGPIFAVSEQGVRCEGRWWRNALGAGKARFTCEDGVSGRATYTYFHKSSGTAKGRGRTNSGERLRFWAGHRYLAYVLADKNETAAMTTCVTEAAKRVAN